MIKEVSKGEVFDFAASIKEGRLHRLPTWLKVDRYLIRPLAAVLVRLVYPTAITPDHLTWMSFFMGLLAAGCFWGGTRGWFLLGGVLALISSTFDGADGMLARSKGLSSRRGAFLDLSLDRVVDWAIYLGVVVGTYRAGAPLWLLGMGLVALSLYLLQTTLYYLYLILRRGDMQSGDTGEVRGLIYFLVLVVGLTGRTDLLVWMMAVMPLVGVPLQIWRIVQYVPEEPAERS